MKKFFAMILALAMVLSLAACGAKAPAEPAAPAAPAETPAETPAEAPAEPVHLLDKPMTFKVATTQASNGLWVKYMTEAYAEITERTNGDLVFEIYPDSELGKNDDCVEQILAGAPMILGCGFDTMTNFSDKLAVASSPYVFQDMSEVFDLVKTDWWDTTVAELADSANLQIFAVGTLGYRHFISSEPIREPADIEKLIVRMGSDLMRNWIAAIGGSPASGAWADNYSNIQTGVFHACEATLDLLWSSALYEVCDYMSLSGHSINPNISIMSAENWNKIPAEYQQIVLEELDAAGSQIWNTYSVKENEWIQKFADAGVEVVYHEDVDVDAFKALIPAIMERQGVSPEEYQKVVAAISGQE